MGKKGKNQETDGKTRREAGYLDSPKCKLCGVETPTMVDAYRHMFWKCERLKDHRSEIWHFDTAFKPEDLPDILACHGTPPALYLDPKQAMWGGEGPEWTRPVEATSPEVKRLIEIIYNQYPGKNARQILERERADGTLGTSRV